MSTFFVESAAFWIIVKASALLGAAAIVQCALRRRASAATRHLVWMLAMVSLLLLPVASVLLPEWAVIPAAATIAQPVSDVDRGAASIDVASSTPQPAIIFESASIVSSAPSAPAATSPATPFSWPAMLILVYAAGAIGLLVHLLAQQWVVRRFARRSTVVHDKEWTQLLAECGRSIAVHRPVRLLRSREHNVPVALGTFRASIVIPEIADTWTDDRRRAVLCHELAHVVRHDCLTQMLACGACAIYWFHPAAWWVARRLRIERELACDDRVIAAGTEARAYAGHLLEIAYALGGGSAPALAVSMARPRQLEGRMLAALDDRRDRTVPALGVRLAGAAFAAALLVSLAVAAPAPLAADERAASLVAPIAASGVPQENTIVPHLQAIEWPVHESVRRLLRAVGAAMGIAQERLPGTWEIRPTTSQGTVRLRLVEVNSSSDSSVPLAQLEGLTAAQLAGDGGPVQFRVRRDAGTFTFDGVLRRGVGAGTFSFTADANFPAELAKRGFARPTADERYQMARHDIGFAFVDELTRQGYAKPQTSELVRAGQHGVNATYLREMGALGYRLGSLEPLITLRDHGVGPAYIRELAELGYKGLSADDIRRARDHGISPEYVRAMRDLGYGPLAMDELINARDHGISEEYVRGLRDAGHGKLPLAQLIRVRDHGVSPEYVRDMRQLGYALPLDDLVRARDHGVSVEFVREMAALGYSGLAIDALIRTRDHGVTPEYARELKALGYDRLAVDDLITLRDHGLTTERIRAANARAGSRLPIDLLRSLASGGMR